MTETDLQLLAAVFREARELANECGEDGAGCDYCEGVPSGGKLIDALDRFKFKASFTVPE